MFRPLEASDVIRQSRAGFTLIEVAIVLAVIGVMTMIAVPSWNQWQRNQQVKDASISVAKAFSLARGEAIRTGNNHIVFFQEDTAGAVLSDESGNSVPILVINDSEDEPCLIEDGEVVAGIPAKNHVSWGVTHADSLAPFDTGDGLMSSGLTFTQTGVNGGNAATWVLFNSRGMATAFAPGCTLAGSGSGGGGVYLTNGKRDYAVVVNALGAIQTHAWNRETGTWSN
jgi:prepilin-type N-terminal cleavage/methylation domain-containing protein